MITPSVTDVISLSYIGSFVVCTINLINVEQFLYHLLSFLN